jgi:hypothetical protein
MFRSLVNDHYPKDPDYPDRMNRIRCLEAVLDGTMYDVLHHDFSQERVAGNYVPINHRRPSIRSFSATATGPRLTPQTKRHART